MTQKQKEKWEEDFDGKWALAGLDYPEAQNEAYKIIKSFISQQIKKARKEILEKVRFEKEAFLSTIGYLGAKFTGILARKKWDNQDIADIEDIIFTDLEALKEKLKKEI